MTTFHSDGHFMNFGRQAHFAIRAVERKAVKAYMSDKHVLNNRQCAVIILAESERYDGIQVIWARLFQERDERENNRT